MRERGLKWYNEYHRERQSRRSREGAWIEIESEVMIMLKDYVAPVRERGLKFILRADQSAV